MRSLYPFIARYCWPAFIARMPHLLVCLLLVGWIPALGQVGCTYRAGAISFVARGGSTNPVYQTQYLLTDSDGRITAISSSASFSGVSAGSYQVYALNYDPTKSLSGNTVGLLVSQLAGPCFDLSAPFPINVCPREGTACDYSVGTITFRATGGNTSPGYLTRYVLTDSTGRITAVTSTASFSVSSPGAYLAYGLNYKDDSSLTGLSVGQSLSGVAASCLNVGAPLIVAVCAQELVSLLPKVYLQGALFGVPGSNPLMRDDLRSKGYLPLSSPYPALGFTEMTTGPATTTGVLSTTGSDAIVDWVFVELRSPVSSSMVVDSRSALVQRDGDIVGVDGVSPLVFSQAVAGSYYVVVRHRNHLGVMSRSALPLSSTATVVDFRRAATPTFSFDSTNAIHQAQVVVDQGRALWAGNSLLDNQVIYQGTANDVNPINSQVINATGNGSKNPSYILAGYYSGDVNLNGETIFQGTTNDVDYIYQNVTRNHPGNGMRVNNFIILEQIP